MVILGDCSDIFFVWFCGFKRFVEMCDKEERLVCEREKLVYVEYKIMEVDRGSGHCLYLATSIN